MLQRYLLPPGHLDMLQRYLLPQQLFPLSQRRMLPDWRDEKGDPKILCSHSIRLAVTRARMCQTEGGILIAAVDTLEKDVTLTWDGMIPRPS
jgi:hypothetical protein